MKTQLLEKEVTIAARPEAVAVRLNKEPEEWNVWAASWCGAQWLGQGATEEEAWKEAAKTALGPKTRTVWCRSCRDPLEIPESAPHPGFCPVCQMNETLGKRKESK